MFVVSDIALDTVFDDRSDIVPGIVVGIVFVIVVGIVFDIIAGIVFDIFVDFAFDIVVGIVLDIVVDIAFDTFLVVVLNGISEIVLNVISYVFSSAFKLFKPELNSSVILVEIVQIDLISFYSWTDLTNSIAWKCQLWHRN